MISNRAQWSEDDESSPSLTLGKETYPFVGKTLPVLSKDGRVTFLSSEQEELLRKKIGSLFYGGISFNACEHAHLRGHFKPRPRSDVDDLMEYIDLPDDPKLRVLWPNVELAENDARRQILATLDRKGVSITAPTDLELAIAPTMQEGVAACPLHDAEIRQLRDQVMTLKAHLRSSLPYLQMYKFGAGSLLVAIVSLIVWMFTGTGVPFHPIFAAMVVPAAIGLMVMAFLVRRDIPGSSIENRK